MPNSFAHIELNTDDVAKAKKFYKSVFAWKLTDSDGGAPYTMIEVGQGTGGGMMTKPMPEAPSAWLPYVEVDDVKKTIAKAKKAGAQIVVEHHEIGAWGAIGVFVDPTGALLGVWEMAKKLSAKKAKKAKKAVKKAKKENKAATKAPAKAGKEKVAARKKKVASKKK